MKAGYPGHSLYIAVPLMKQNIKVVWPQGCAEVDQEALQLKRKEPFIILTENDKAMEIMIYVESELLVTTGVRYNMVTSATRNGPHAMTSCSANICVWHEQPYNN